MSLPIDQATKVQYHALCLIALADDCDIRMLKASELLSVTLAFTFEIFGNLLLQNKRLKGIVALLLSTRQADRETSGVVLLLVDENCKPAVLPLVVLNLDFKVLGLLCELFGKRLEFEELPRRQYCPSPRYCCSTHLLLPALQLLHEEVISLRDFGQLRVHSTFQIDKVLPCLQCIPRVLIAFADNLIEMSHRDLGHQRLLDRTTKDRFHAGIASLLEALAQFDIYI